MRKNIAMLILAALLLSGCSLKKETTLEPWTVPTIEPAPTVQPTAAPAYSENVLQPERYVWNEAVLFNMSNPGVTTAATQQTCSHKESLALLGSQLLPDSVFGESYGKYSKLTLQKSQHDVILDESGALAEHAYVEYKYLPKNKDEGMSLTVSAELCGYDAVMSMYSSRLYPHITYGDESIPELSTYYLTDFILTKLGEARYAQWLVLPGDYLSYAERVLSAAEDAGEAPNVQRQILLTFSCGEDMSDEEFISAVCTISRYAAGTRSLPVENEKTLPGPGEKGAA